jgi:hypothetical protein
MDTHIHSTGSLQVKSCRNQLSNEQIARDLVTQHLKKATDLHRKQHKELCNAKLKMATLEEHVKELKTQVAKALAEADHRGGMVRVRSLCSAGLKLQI